MARRALLIGIDCYQDTELAIESPRNDVAMLSEALRFIGYTQENIHVVIDSNGPSLSTSTLGHRIRAFFGDARGDDELLLYVSSHGIEQEGHRLIVPSDYFRDSPPKAHEMVGDQVLYGYARRSAARSIVVIIDACREGVRLVLSEDAVVKSATRDRGEGVGTGGATPTVVVLYSCAAGAFSRAQGGPNGCSYFTLALCDVLKRDDETAELEEIVVEVNRELRSLLTASNLPEQTATFDERPIVGVGGPPYRLLIKENRIARVRQRIASSRWCNEVENGPLWQSIHGEPALVSQTQWVVLNAEALVDEAERRLPHDRWRDRHTPGRVLARIGQLIAGAPRAVTPPEAALLIVAIHLYEAALAAGQLRLARTGDPVRILDHPVDVASDRMWRALRGTVVAEEALVRRHALLTKEGNDRAATDLITWELNRFLHASGELWEYAPASTNRSIGWINDSIRPLLDAAPLPEAITDGRLAKLFEGRRLMRLTRLGFAGEEEIELESLGEANRRLEKLRLGDGPTEWDVDEVSVAHLLCMAMTLSADPRRMSPVLAEHLGRPADIHASTLREAFNSAIWRREGDKLVLDLECRYEVVDFTASELLRDLNRHRQSMNEGGAVRPEILKALPRYFDDRQLRAELDADGRPLYLKPHFRLSMDQSRVRELLMGKALYGKADLALRELYQNAMDACRYRQARTCYLQRIGRPVEPYAGHITLRIGREGERAFVECSDNGIGMASRQLRTLFARAGQRFTDTHEFHIENAMWQEAGVTFWPNSRFGIGVFSYFMLADELVVESKRLKLNGFDFDVGLRLQAVGSGSLFRIQEVDDVPPGTRVRLYLNHTDALDDYLSELEKWLWLPEFRTTLINIHGHETRFEAGQPTPSFQGEERILITVPESAGENGHPRLFWYLEGREDDHYDDTSTRLLVDGILTPLDKDKKIPFNALAVNLTGELRPELSVDRTRILSVPDLSDWMSEQIRKGAYKHLVGHRAVSMRAFERNLTDNPLALYLLDRDLRAGALAPAHVTVVTSAGKYTLTLEGLGFAPLLDELAIAVCLDGPDVNDWSSGGFRKTLEVIAEHADRRMFGQWIAARISALNTHGLAPLPIGYSSLARFAAHSEWSDADSVGLCLLSRNKDSFRSINAWMSKDFDEVLERFGLTEPELTAFACSIARLGGNLADVGSKLERWLQLRRSATEQSRECRELKEFIDDASRVTAALLVFASHRFGITLAEVETLVRALAAAGEMEPVTFPSGCPTPSAESLRLLFPRQFLLQLDSGSPMSSLFKTGIFWRFMVRGGDAVNRLHWSHLVLATVALQLPREQVVELARPLADWGIALPDLQQDVLADLDPEIALTVVFHAIRQDLNGPWLIDKLAFARILHVFSAKRAHLLSQIPVLEELGITFPPIDSMPGSLPTEDLAWRLLNADLNTDLNGPRERVDRFTLRHLARAALIWEVPFDTVVGLARQWAAFGIPCDSISISTTGLRADKRQREIFLGEESRSQSGSDLLELERVIECSDRWDIPIDQVIELARPWALALYEQVLPTTPFHLNSRVRQLLKAKKRLLWRKTLTAWDLAVTAVLDDAYPADYEDALKQFEAFGVDTKQAREFAAFSRLAPVDG